MNSDDDRKSRESWNAISATYQQRRQLTTHTVNLGGLVEDEFGASLFLDVQGKWVLDAGCGGGQNCIALARMGARAMGVDSSKAQIQYARALAAHEGFDIPFSVCDVVDLGEIAEQGWDVLLSVAVLHYLADPLPALKEAVRALLPGGRLILSVDHPVRALFFEPQEQEWSPYPVRNYHPQEGEERSANWRYPDTEVALTTWHHTIEEWVALVAEAGLQIQSLLEPPAPRVLLDDLWPHDDALSPLRHIPHTLILIAQKPNP
jgi:SAM-dependent methyltransferase